MNSASSTRKEGMTKNLARATSLPAELNRYSKNCKLLCNILRDTKIIINEINTADYLTQDELPSLQVNPDKLHVINELVDKSVALVVLGYSNKARAILTNELVGGKSLFPVIETNVDSKNEDTTRQCHWKGVKIRHTSFCLVGLSTTLGPTTLPFSQSIISYDNLVIDCNSPQAKDIYCDLSMMDVNIKHFLFRDGTQVWVAPSFHPAENRFNGNWCSFSPSDFLSLVNQCTTPVFLYAVHGTQLNEEEKSQLKLFKQLLPSSTVIHFVLNSGTIPKQQNSTSSLVITRPNIGTGGRHRRHTSIHPDRVVGSPTNFPVSEAYTKENPSTDHIVFAYEPISEIGFSTRECGFVDGGIQSTVDELTCGVTSCLPFVRSVLQNQLLQSAKILNECHNQMLSNFILSAFDWARQVQVTPLRLEYVKQKEGELFNRLLAFANKKQEEIRLLISQTMVEMRDELIRAAIDYDIFREDCSSVDHHQLRKSTEEIQNLVLALLNKTIAEKLTSSVLSLRETYLGTLQRCLSSLEKAHQHDTHDADRMSEQDSYSDTQRASESLKQIINAAYQVQLNVKSSASFVHSLWERLHQFLRSLTLPKADTLSATSSGSGSWSTSSDQSPMTPTEWKTQVAVDLLDSLSDNRLARVICSQFRDRLRQAHVAFLDSLRELESVHTGRLEKNEELFLRLRKILVPRVARLALESTSLKDMILFGMPQLGRELGRGQYGVVYSCDSWGPVAERGIRCAVKSVVPPDDKHWNDLAMEFHYSRMVPPHDRIVSLIGSVIDHSYGGGASPAVLLIMERMNRDLHTALKMSLTWPKRLRVSIDVVEGIRFLHSQGLVHRDIKLKNVLLDPEDRAKITDLGFCKPEAMMSGSIVGTPIHMAPELFTGHYDSSVDVYAFGILFWYICAGHTKLPYAFEQCQNKDQLWQCVRRGTRPERLPCFDDACWTLMEDCWAKDPNQRPLLGFVYARLEAIFLSHCHGRIVDTGSIVIQREHPPDSLSSSPYIQIDLEPCQ
ncbi:dual serine/threonine and tyrosine protein kinase-like isoform X1 [Daphnia carinata]|uniref:dual serine/threonine and tyrosine protein kinase-like isoform X1 n=2 Tax=Daphnia carinata TaxID=120202 RepID=UPI0025811CEA|nr:dual serine/threonine and tyrosine protein kinase-like isoform X1 [Daphnia carinata]